MEAAESKNEHVQKLLDIAVDFISRGKSRSDVAEYTGLALDRLNNFLEKFDKDFSEKLEEKRMVLAALAVENNYMQDDIVNSSLKLIQDKLKYDRENMTLRDAQTAVSVVKDVNSIKNISTQNVASTLELDSITLHLSGKIARGENTREGTNEFILKNDDRSASETLDALKVQSSNLGAEGLIHAEDVFDVENNSIFSD